MKILSAAEMAATDKASVTAGVSLDVLMENAGAAVARFCMQEYPQAEHIAVLCGKGNNGGDGLVAARRLREAGRDARVVLLGRVADLHDAAQDALRAFAKDHLAKIVEVADERAIAVALERAQLLIDAVVGTGFKPPLRGLAAAARDVVAHSTVPVVAVDLPSGWDADSLEQSSDGAFRASAVVTFTAPKLAHVFGHLTPPDVFGPVVVADIGSPADAVRSGVNLSWTGSSKALTERPRNINSNKGKYGHVLVASGSAGKSGAPAMASLAAMRAGAGLVTAAVPASILPTVAATAPELMCAALSERDGSVERANAEGPALESLLKGITVVATGPGLGTAGEATEFAQELVRGCTLPMVLDADALNAFAGRTELLARAPAGVDGRGRPRVLVLTPHPGEMARLLGSTVADVEADRIGVARRFATAHGVTLVLKGWRTLVAHPDGRVAVNTTGNPSMAKGGSGDILTGIVAALLAQHPHDVAAAVEAAVFLHGLAGDYAVLAQDQHTVLATDTVSALWKAFGARVKDEAGFMWIAGSAINGAEPLVYGATSKATG